MRPVSPKVQLIVRNSGRPGQKGFSLLEVLVAFSILALSLGVLMQIFSGGLRNVDQSTHHAQAVAIAKSLLARVGTETPVVAGEQRGEFNEYSWQLSLQALEDPPESGQPMALSLFGLMGVTVNVEWQDGPAGRRSLTLNSTKLYTKAP